MHRSLNTKSITAKHLILLNIFTVNYKSSKVKRSLSRKGAKIALQTALKFPFQQLMLIGDFNQVADWIFVSATKGHHEPS